MAPRKEGSHILRNGDDRCEQTQADYELFLQAFEKPTQIYRYLKFRNKISPTFLTRNLSYMMRPRTISTRKRKDFKVNSLLETRKESENIEDGVKGAYMTITFLGFYDKKRNEKITPKVKLDLSLQNMTLKKRKESSSPVAMIPLGCAEVPVNPSESNPPNKAPALSISSKHLDVSKLSGARVKSSTLVFRMSAGSNEPEENVEPAAKRRKMGRGDDAMRTGIAELTITDRHSRLQLTEGEYELIMGPDEMDDRKISPKKASWELIDVDGTDKTAAAEFSKFNESATVKFRLSWASETAGALVERPRPLMPRDNGTDASFVRREKTKKKEKSVEKSQRIVYQFLYNNNSRQLTEAREDLHCPWCGLNCVVLVSLLKHLKLCHPRFLFTYVPMPDCARIDVSVSELFDSTYVGNPHDMISQPPGFAFSRNGPVQRTSITIILVFKPKRCPPSLSEFLELEDNENAHFENQRPFISGHNRLYHDSTTALPIPPHAIINNQDLDEEDRPDPEWLLLKTSKMIDDFTDVNLGEKEFMKIWNHHVQKYTYVGDCQMPQALKMFIDERAHQVIQKGLYRNFILHLVNLYEFGVVGPSHIFTAIARLQSVMRNKGLQYDLCWSGLRKRFASSNGTGSMEEANNRARNDFSGIFKKYS